MSINVLPADIPEDVHKSRYELAEKLEKMLANDKNWYGQAHHKYRSLQR